MQLTTENILLFGSLLLFASILSSKTSARLGIPTLILFLVVGMLAGSDGIGGIYFDDPKIAQFLGVAALNFILFSGGLETKWESIKPILRQGISLATIGVFLTALTVGLFVHWITDFSLLEGLLLGAVVSSTDAAAVFSILRSKSIGLKGGIRPLLELESGSNDPLAYVLTITLTQIIVQGEANYSAIALKFVLEMVLGGLFGLIFGKAMIWIINKIKLDTEGLYPVLLLAMIFFIFSFTDLLGGNGFLAVYLSGVLLGNNKFIHKKSLLKFYDGQAWLMQIIMFLTLGLLVFPSKIPPVVGPGLLISFFLIFVARPIGVFISLSFFRMKTREKLFISWVGLRGAVPIVFATYPLIAGIGKADMIFNLVFFISATSVLLQGTILGYVARKLHVYVPEKSKRRFPLDLELSEVAKSELTEITLPKESNAIGKKIVELNFPVSSSIVMIKRNNKYFIPTGATQLVDGDNMLITADNTDAIDEIHRLLGIWKSPESVN
ncbi:MAG: potassium/proton antiporter [Bacteroidetes bacterium]|nr:MAG: potassium/proton antiporter [Bacteroidota bacterium]